MSAQREPIGVIGTGYVGLVTAAGFAELGSDVYCVDIDANKIERLRNGQIPIYEPGLEELVASNTARLHFSTTLDEALEHARLLFVAVGTPPTYSGDADLSAVKAVVDAMPPSDRHALVMKSTVPCGTGASIRRRFIEAGKAGFSYVSCPEFLKEGSAVRDFLKPDRVVVGDEGDWAGDAVVELYAPLDAPLVRTDVASAEMVKLASNAFLATKISFINEIANVCEETGADVIEVARGMGYDDRIGPKFLQAGIGYGGSCLTGDETVLVRHRGRTTLLSFEALWKRLEAEDGLYDEGVIEPAGLEVLSWVPGVSEAQFLPVMCATRRDFDGDVLEIQLKTGRRVRCTPDHVWLTSDGANAAPVRKFASELGQEDWLPLSMRSGEGDEVPAMTPFAAATAAAERRTIFAGAASVGAPTGDVKRGGALRLDERVRAGLPLDPGLLATARDGSRVRNELTLDDAFWRVVGLYIAEGCHSVETPRPGAETHRVIWSFHPVKEQHLVDEVVAYWTRHGFEPRVADRPTSKQVIVQSRLVGTWWTRVLGLGSNGYEQRLPDWIWDRSDRHKWALLSGYWEGDGSWSLVNGGPSVTLEAGTVSDELADGLLRLLASLGIVASQHVHRTGNSTKDPHWLQISGADQVERAIELVPKRDRAGVLASIARQSKRTAPTGSRQFDQEIAWLRITAVERRAHAGPVYSLEVPLAHSFVTTGGVVSHNCFPKDVSALKQLAGNSGYHFQLLNAVIEVNELQKRRVVGKLQKHLGTLVGKTVTLLGLAFKPNTDDMREASSLVLAARLQAEGAHVRAFDPVSEAEARELMTGVEFAGSALEAVNDADALVLVTEWAEFKELDWAKVAESMTGTLVIDGRNALDADAVRAANLIYEGVGRR